MSLYDRLQYLKSDIEKELEQTERLLNQREQALKSAISLADLSQEAFNKIKEELKEIEMYLKETYDE